MNVSRYLAALFQPLLHLLSWQVDVDGYVWRQELTDANVFDLIVMLHTCRAQLVSEVWKYEQLSFMMHKNRLNVLFLAFFSFNKNIIAGDFNICAH